MVETLAVVILTQDEEKHIQRAIRSVAGFASEILVCDSGSQDRTTAMARHLGASVVSHPWKNHAAQFNYALTQLKSRPGWVMKLDADEYCESGFFEEIEGKLNSAPEGVDGFLVQRWMIFQGRRLRWGGVFPKKIVRIFRYGCGCAEARWMDEHIVVNGEVMSTDACIVDCNLSTLTHWVAKHNDYACKEAVDYLQTTAAKKQQRSLSKDTPAGRVRIVKERFYYQLPLGFRALQYFIYRYFLRLGFLDGMQGLAFHGLQGLWYRFLVDVKIWEVQRHMRANSCSLSQSVEHLFSMKIAEPESEAVGCK